MNHSAHYFSLNTKEYILIVWSNVQCQCILGMKSWKLNSEIAPWPLWTTFFHACIINMFLWLFCICWFCLEFLYKSHRKKGELQSKLKFSSQIIALLFIKTWLSRNKPKYLFTLVLIKNLRHFDNYFWKTSR